MRILYFGMYGEFSLIPLRALYAAGFHICGVVVPTAVGKAAIHQPFAPIFPPGSSLHELPLLGEKTPANIVQFAWNHHLPTHVLSDPQSSVAQEGIRELKPDVAFVACFSRLLPTALLEIPPYGFLNLHPSLLPRFRGPEPLFWTFRQGETETGVTVHHLDEGLDSGPIAFQTPLTLSDGIYGQVAERQCAILGSELFLQVMALIEEDAVPRIPQSGEGSYYPSPSLSDFRIETSWTARRAFNFMRGTEHWRQPYLIETENERFRLRRAMGFSSEGNLERPALKQGHKLRIQMNLGILEALIW